MAAHRFRSCCRAPRPLAAGSLTKRHTILVVPSIGDATPRSARIDPARRAQPSRTALRVAAVTNRARLAGMRNGMLAFGRRRRPARRRGSCRDHLHRRCRHSHADRRLALQRFGGAALPWRRFGRKKRGRNLAPLGAGSRPLDWISCVAVNQVKGQQGRQGVISESEPTYVPSNPFSRLLLRQPRHRNRVITAL
jgi:hypothetical protein